MDDRRVADYFVVAGLPDNPQPLEEFTNEAAIKPTYKQDPITDITIINKTLGEKVPRGYVCLDKTPTDYLADLNHGSIRCPEMFICYRRSRDKPPLTDVGVLYEGKERLMAGCEVVHTTYFGSPASVNNTNSSRIYITYRRAAENAPSDMLAVVDLCVILENKNEIPPHSYCQIHKNLNKGLVGSDVFLCYKKAMTKMDILAYKPAILDRYPKEDYEDFPLPDSVPMFCLPMGATIECWSAKAQHPFPVFSTFILTGQGWNKVYGAAITFYEEFPENKLTDLQMRHLGLKNKHIREQYRIMKTVHSNRSICLLSHWPFFDAFRKLLSYMYRISITGPHTVPIERHISHFMYDVPYPSPQRPRILVQLAQDSLSLSMPEDSPLPQSGASFITMLKNLGPENCMTILLYVLHEYKILIHSLRPAVLTSVAEAVSTLIFPLQWQCPYIPLCPLDLSLVLNAPTPYIIGLDSRYFDLFDPPPDVICIDLDTIRIWPGEDKKNVTYKMLPKKPTKVLQETLHTLYDRLAQELPRHNQDEITLDMAPIDYDFKRKHKETLLELQIQEAFLRFMACLMKGYKQYLKPIENAPNIDTTNAASLFDMTAFLKSRDKANHKFFQTLIRTQLFNRFIEERSFVSDKDDSLAFFDECTEKVDENKDEPKLIELDDSSKSERTMFILPPEPVGLPEGKTYSYNGFPQLNSELFLERKAAVTSTQSKGKVTHNSPVARRTKQEIRMAQKLAQQSQSQPEMWAQCLLSNCYSLWFMMLPAFIKNTQTVIKTLNVAYEVLKTMQRHKLKPPDELCYRAMLQLCGQYNQPVLAVKVYSEMKHAGVQPNAITYGYYNKAVLEGKWPSSISKGRKLWRKVRNVIIGVAKFRKAIRRRSISVYSNSGSEFDQTSIDSFLEDGHLEGKHESIMKGEVDTGMNGTAGKRGAELERAASDRGYNSMTQEDAKSFSEMINSENKEDTTESKVKKEVKNVLRFSFRKKKKETEIQEENDDAFKESSSMQQFRSRVGSIVRQHSQPGTISGSHETLKGSLIGSSAGLLMVSDSLTVGSLPHSMSPVGRSLASQESTRKRHRSAGDHHHLKTRSNSLYANFRQRHQTQEDHLSDLTVTDEDPNILLEDVGGSSELRSEMQDIKEEIKDSGVALDENDAAGSEGFMFQDDVLLEEEGGEVSVTGNQSSSTLVNSESGTWQEPKFRDSRACSVEGQKGHAESLKSATSSPLHSVPTPVTENDPLGLFMDGQPKVAALKNPTPKTSPQKSRESFELRKPFEEELKNKNSRVETLSLGECNNSDKNRVEKPISSMSGRVMSPVDRVQKTLFSKIERTNSFPESLGNASGGEANKTRGDAHSNETVSLGRSSTSLYDQRTDSSGAPKGDFRLFRTGSFRRHKENFSGMLKFATGAVANKISEIKLSMTPSKLGSNTSLTTSHDDVDSVDEDSYRESSRRKKGSIDFLNRSNDKLDSSSINGTSAFESAPAHPSFMDQMDRLCEKERHHIPHVQFTCDPKDMLIEVEICSLSRCQRCSCLLYDEEIMAGWNPDDSNLNTNCSFCNNKVVPHLLIYLKDKRGKKKNTLVDIDGEDVSNLDPGESHVTAPDQSYGKDAGLCQTLSGDHQLLFGEDLEDTGSVKSFDSPNDPWVKQTGNSSSHALDIPSPSRTEPSEMSLSDAAYTARHRRTASECLTSATENMYSSSIESHDSFTFRNMRSSLSISIDETEPLPSQPPVGQDSKQAIFDRGGGQTEPVSVPYLSPIVLRKNLENIIESEGNSSLAKDTFLDEHPIIFWNLVWYFKRISTSSHLPGFLLTAKSYNKDSELPLQESKPEQRLGSESVHIRVMWDNIRIHNEIGLPMHMAWNKGHSSTTVDALITESQPFNRAVMHQIITSITHCSDVLTPIKIVMNGRRRYRPRRKRFRSMYREILYLAFVACGRENIDPDAYDREFKYAYSKLSPGEIKRLQRDDKPRTQMVKCCRNAFCELEV